MANTAVLVNRSVFTDDKFHERYQKAESPKSVSPFKRWRQRQGQCSWRRAWEFVSSVFPVLSWLPKYERSFLMGDFIAGWTVGIIRIPQGMAYALLAGVQPVYGLYSCFFPVLLWFVFSTSHHTSVGTMAVVCLMIQNLISQHVSDLDIVMNGTSLLVNGVETDLKTISAEYFYTGADGLSSFNSTKYIYDAVVDQENMKIQIATSATLLVGIIQLGMALFRLGFLTTLLSDPVIQGFTTGTAFHIVSTQVEYLFGLDNAVGKYSGPFAIFKTFSDIFTNLYQSNVTDVVITAICLPTLFIVKYLNDKYKTKLKNIPIPVELILVVMATLISYFCNLDDAPYNVNIVKNIPTGFPSFSVPSYINLWSDMISDCIIMAFISVAISLSLTKVYADKHHYEIDANQEILALGICNTFPAFLSSFAVAASLSRTAIQESTGGKTQLVAVISSVLMLIVLLWLAPLFQPVPKSVLACIIIVALKSLFLQFTKLKNLWFISKFDFAIWLVTCATVITLGVELGLAVGVVFAIVLLLFRIQHPRHAILGRILFTDIYADHVKYEDAKEVPGIKIFQFADSVSFTNKDSFRNALYKSIGCNPSTVLAKLDRLKKQRKQNTEIPLVEQETESSSSLNKPFKSRRTSYVEEQNEVIICEEGDNNKNKVKDNKQINSVLGFNVLIFDATMWSFVDSTASREIIQIIDVFQNLNVEVLIGGAMSNVLATLNGCGLDSRVGKNLVFVTLHDAVTHAEKVNQLKCQEFNKNLVDKPYIFMPGYPGYDLLSL